MFDRLPIGPRTITMLLRKLADNPLLAALFIISPADALRVLGLDALAALLDPLWPTAPADVRRAELLRNALAHGRTTLEQPQLVQPAAGRPAAETAVAVGEPAAEAPGAPAADTPRLAPADVTLSVSTTTIQHVLKLYAAQHFSGQEFTLPPQRWGQLRVTGDTLTLDWAPGQARLVATFQGKLMVRMPLLGGRGLDLGAVESPLVVDVQVAVAIDGASQLVLDIRHGDIRLPDVPLPEILADELSRKLIAAVPTIPLLDVPTRFEIPDASGQAAGAVLLTPRGVHMVDDGVRLEFQLVQG